MITSNQKNTKVSVKIFRSTRVMVLSALFIALSIIFGKFLKISIGDSIRISFENLPILMAGIFFGPIVGGVVAVGADIIGCILYGYAINPVITLGAASIGIISGLVSQYMKNNHIVIRTALSVALAHLVGSVIIKSIGLYLYYQTPMQTLLMRIPTYIGIGAMEFVIITLLISNKAFEAEIKKFRNG